MNNNELDHAVGIFATRKDAEAALRELRDRDFNLNRVAVITRDAKPEKKLDGREVKPTKEQAKVATENILGRMGDLEVLTLPDVEVGAVLANTLLDDETGVTGDGLISRLIDWRIPENRATYFQELLWHGHYLVLLEGTQVEVDGAEAVLKRKNILHWGVYRGQIAHPITGTGII